VSINAHVFYGMLITRCQVCTFRLLRNMKVHYLCEVKNKREMIEAVDVILNIVSKSNDIASANRFFLLRRVNQR
jgi:protein-arginine kinase